MKTLKDVYPNWKTGTGIFNALRTFSPPWASDIDSSLDLQYYGNHSGEKVIAPLVNALLEDDETLSALGREMLAATIWRLYGAYWAKEYATLSLTYNPIQNYDMTETETESGTAETETKHTGTDNHTTSATHTGTDTTETEETHTGTNKHTTSATHTGTDTTVTDKDVTAANSASNTNGIFGFNSGASVPADTQTGTTSGSQNEDTTETKTLNLSDAGTDNETLNLSNDSNATRTLDLSNAGTDNRTLNLTDAETKEDERSRTLRRSGNIGVTTSQQMLQAERELWQWNFFENIVFPDLDKILIVRIY